MIQIPCARKGQILFCKKKKTKKKAKNKKQNKNKKKKQKQKHSDNTKQFSETDTNSMLEFLIDNIFVIFGVRVFNRQSA